MPATVVSITEDLWKNARDSIFHALEHFLELSLGEGEKFHHTKWIVLSVHHLAETFCGMLLKEFDPTNAIFKRGQQDSWPSLVPAIDELLAPKYRSRLTGGEIRLLDLLRGLNDSRNRIMHGVAPEGLDLSLAAMSILGLSRVAHRRRGESVRDILQADPSIGFHAVEAIHYKKIDDYNRFVEAFLAEEFPGKYRPQCEACGASCIVDMRCEACFERMESFFCEACDEELLLPESRRLRGETEVICPSCGKKISA